MLQFESRPGDPELGRLIDSTMWINDAHPAFTRALASRSLGYHTALAVALALAPLAVDARDEHAFITQFLTHWGGAQAAPRRAADSGGGKSVPEHAEIVDSSEAPQHERRNGLTERGEDLRSAATSQLVASRDDGHDAPQRGAYPTCSARQKAFEFRLGSVD